jgi:hypothetical protein
VVFYRPGVGWIVVVLAFAAVFVVWLIGPLLGQHRARLGSVPE